MTQRSGSSVEAWAATLTDLTPATRAEFAAAITPCLQLVAPMGMDAESQDAWLESAFVALHGIPFALLRRGAQAAMAKADHPSKIVPAISAAVRDDWEWRKRYNEPKPTSSPMPWRPSDEERREVGEMIGDLIKKLG
ncbi:MAG: hypothetical protein ACK4S3_06150 [Parvibaculum sp.]